MHCIKKVLLKPFVTLCRWDCQDQEYSAGHKDVSLVYFSTFEPINLTILTPNSIMQRAKVSMLYYTPSNYTPSNQSLPCLYVCPEDSVLGQAPLIPCFITCNTHQTIPYKFKDRRIAETAADPTR